MGKAKQTPAGKPPIERARKPTLWLRGIYQSISGRPLDLAKLTENGEYPIIYIYQTYNPNGGDDGYGIRCFKAKPDGSLMTDEEFQREFSKRGYHLHFPSVCEVDTREAIDEGRVDAPTE